MKKSIIILLSLFFLLTACTKNSAKNSLNQLPGNYGLNDAKNDNCVIFENSDIIYGQMFEKILFRQQKKACLLL